MLNARTWHWLCVSAYMMFPAIFIVWMSPKDSPFMWPAALAVLWGFIIGGVGAVLGILMACGKLHMGCPNCHSKSFVSGGDRDGMYLECPQCGDLRLKIGRVFGLQTIRCGTGEDDLADHRAHTDSPLLAPIRHPIPFAIIFLPVLASITIASVIHEFSFFYLLIPGFWCYAVGGFLLDGIFSGNMSDNHGTAVRARNPIGFWGKIFIWSLAYIFAACFPIGYALQERHSAASESKQEAEPSSPAKRQN